MSATRLRIASLCGSTRPHFSGTEDFLEVLLKQLSLLGADPVSVDIGRWKLARIRTLLGQVAAVRPDVILMQYPTDAFGRGLLPQLFAMLQSMAPFALTLHEFTAAHPLRRVSLAPLLVRASAVVVTAEREREALLRWYPWTRRIVHMLPIGTNIPAHPWVPVDPPEIVYFGQIRPNKGLEDFIACRDRLVDGFPHARFRIIGSPVPQFAAYGNQIASAAASKDIEILGGLADAEVATVLSRAQCALLPFPGGASLRRTSLLAAAGCGVPIVTLSGPDTPHELQDLLQMPDVAGELASRVADLLRDKAMRVRSSQRSRAVAKLASWDTVAARYMDVLRSISAGGEVVSQAVHP